MSLRGELEPFLTLSADELLKKIPNPEAPHDISEGTAAVFMEFMAPTFAKHRTAILRLADEIDKLNERGQRNSSH